MSFSGDQVDKLPRNKGFTKQEEYLQLVKADVILAFFGYNESFDGVDSASSYRDRLVRMVKNYRAAQPNGKSFPRFVLFSPIAFENTGNPNLPTGIEHNVRLAAYTEATRQAAHEAGVAYVDLYAPTFQLFETSDENFTLNGAHLSAEGNRRLAEIIATELLGNSISVSSGSSNLRDAVLDKNWNWHNRYRATDGNDVWGGRSTLRFVDNQSNAEVLKHELVMLDVMTANRDENIWAVAEGRKHEVSDADVPAPIPVTSNVGGKSRSPSAAKEGNTTYMKPGDALEKIKIPEGYELNVFASEQMFPDLANPVQLQVDGKGRLWAASWNTYPKWEPLKPMNDCLMIFPDENRDGVADKRIVFAYVHNPLGFEFWNGGVLVTSGPDLLFLKDTDGDDKADVRIVLLQGFGT
ncbi:MAG: GDSL-type esterase/lipase family protein, partial [Verrucomicrobiota bacterium]